MNETKALTLAQINGRLFTIITNLFHKTKLDMIKVYYRKDCIMVNLVGKLYTISSEKDLIIFKEDVKLLMK